MAQTGKPSCHRSRDNKVVYSRRQQQEMTTTSFTVAHRRKGQYLECQRRKHQRKNEQTALLEEVGDDDEEEKGLSSEYEECGKSFSFNRPEKRTQITSNLLMYSSTFEATAFTGGIIEMVDSSTTFRSVSSSKALGLHPKSLLLLSHHLHCNTLMLSCVYHRQHYHWGRFVFLCLRQLFCLEYGESFNRYILEGCTTCLIDVFSGNIKLFYWFILYQCYEHFCLSTELIQYLIQRLAPFYTWHFCLSIYISVVSALMMGTTLFSYEQKYFQNLYVRHFLLILVNHFSSSSIIPEFHNHFQFIFIYFQTEEQYLPFFWLQLLW